MIHIINDGTGDFTTITAALESIPADNRSPVTLFIHNGTYNERLTVTAPYVTLIGESSEHTTVTYDLSARMTMEDGTKLGTFRSYSCLIGPKQSDPRLMGRHCRFHSPGRALWLRDEPLPFYQQLSSSECLSGTALEGVCKNGTHRLFHGCSYL